MLVLDDSYYTGLHTWALLHEPEASWLRARVFLIEVR
jgi:hypothetical protein